MVVKEECQAYQNRWKEVEAVVAEERRTASLELRWQQLNSAYAMAQKLGWVREDQSEAEVFALWAKLKKEAILKSPKI
jgi:hypothetical protein